MSGCPHAGPGPCPAQRRRYAAIRRRASRPEGAEVGRGGAAGGRPGEAGRRPRLLNPDPGGTTHDEPQSIPPRSDPRPGRTRPRTTRHGVRSLDRDRPPLPLWHLVRCGPLELPHSARARPVAGVPPWGLVRLSITMNSPKRTASGSTGRRRPAATPGAATWKSRSFTVTTRAPPFRRRPPSRRTQTCKQPACRLPATAAHGTPERQSLAGRGAAEGRPGGCPVLSNTHQEETT